MEALLEAGAPVLARNVHGQTPRQVAEDWGYDKIAERLELAEPKSLRGEETN